MGPESLDASTFPRQCVQTLVRWMPSSIAPNRQTPNPTFLSVPLQSLLCTGIVEKFCRSCPAASKASCYDSGHLHHFGVFRSGYGGRWQRTDIEGSFVSASSSDSNFELQVSTFFLTEAPGGLGHLVSPCRWPEDAEILRQLGCTGSLGGRRGLAEYGAWLGDRPGWPEVARCRRNSVTRRGSGFGGRVRLHLCLRLCPSLSVSISVIATIDSRGTQLAHSHFAAFSPKGGLPVEALFRTRRGFRL